MHLFAGSGASGSRPGADALYPRLPHHPPHSLLGPLGGEAKSDAVAAAKAEVIAKAETPETTARADLSSAAIELEILNASSSSPQAPGPLAPVTGPAAPRSSSKLRRFLSQNAK